MRHGARADAALPRSEASIHVPTMSRRSIASVLVLLAAASAVAGPTFEEVPDAGSSPSTAQPVSGAGTGGRIKGELTATADADDFEDMYLVCINDPNAFSATVDPMATDFDTQLWLFRLDGTGILGNDNNAAAFPTIYSRLLPAANDGSGSAVTAPGLYLLAISSKANKPLSQGGPIFHDATVAGVEITGPDGPGGEQPISGWSHARGTVGGHYAINLTGVKPFEVPCEIACPAGAAIDADAFDCAPFAADVNGGCSEPGNPLQTIGALSPGDYRAVCGTTGVESDGSGPVHKDRDWFRFATTAPGYLYGSLVSETLAGPPIANVRLTLFKGDDCATQVEIGSIAGGACPLSFGPLPVTADTYVLSVTLDGGLAAGPACPAQYVLWLHERPTAFAACADPAAANCFLRHPSAGCDKPLCCDDVCMIDPSCCEAAWDGGCVGLALNVCIGPPCPADLNGDNVVGGADLAILLGQWGGGPGSQSDLTDDGTVDAADLAVLLGAWGDCG